MYQASIIVRLEMYEIRTLSFNETLNVGTLPVLVWYGDMAVCQHVEVRSRTASIT